MMRPEGQRHEAAGDDGRQHRPPVRGGQLRRGEASDTGEGDLAEPDHAPLPRHEREGQEDDAVGERLGHEAHPETLDEDGQQRRDHDEQPRPSEFPEAAEGSLSRVLDAEPASWLAPGA